jgi:thiamine biosynthesis lipoprotein
MQQTELIMGMPITVTIVDPGATSQLFDKVFDYFRAVDQRYSTYKDTSEISQINDGLPKSKWSDEMKEVLRLCEQTKQQTDGYFDIAHGGQLDPSGLVKGWAINNAAELLRSKGVANFSIDAGGDIQVHGDSPSNKEWRLGIRNPFDSNDIIKVIGVRDQGVATSGTYVRGQHVYNPKTNQELTDIVSLTVIGPNIYEADRFATAAFAMGAKGIDFIENMKGFEGYMIDKNGTATKTTGFEEYER